MIHIIGENIIEQAQAFNDVRDALDFDHDVYLGAMWATPLGVELSDVAVYNMEPLYDDSPLFPEYLDTLKRCHVIDYCMSNVEYLKAKGVDAFYMPYGYHDKLSRRVKVKKDIDVLFVGSSHFERRQKVFKELDKRVKFVLGQGVYGEDLDILIGRAKVHLNVHHISSQQLEVVRLNYLLANGCTVVSEYGKDQDVNDMYEHSLFFSDYEDLVESCIYAIENPIRQIGPIMKHDCTQANLWLNSRGEICQQYLQQ